MDGKRKEPPKDKLNMGIKITSAPSNLNINAHIRKTRTILPIVYKRVKSLDKSLVYIIFPQGKPNRLTLYFWLSWLVNIEHSLKYILQIEVNLPYHHRLRCKIWGEMKVMSGDSMTLSTQRREHWKSSWPFTNLSSKWRSTMNLHSGFHLLETTLVVWANIGGRKESICESLTHLVIH